MKGIAAQFRWFGVGLFCLVTVGWVLASPQGKPHLKGLPMDWTQRRVIFSQPATAEQARLLANEPRFWQQEYRRQALRAVSNGMAAADEANSLALAFKGVSTANVHRDWSQDIGSGASTGAGNYPAKYGFQVTVANCVSSGHPDFVVFSTGVSGDRLKPALLPTTTDSWLHRHGPPSFLGLQSQRRVYPNLSRLLAGGHSARLHRNRWDHSQVSSANLAEFYH